MKAIILLICSLSLINFSCSDEKKLQGRICAQGKVITPWCDNTSVVQILTPGLNIGQTWTDVSEPYVYFENVVHVGFISPLEYPEGAIFYFRYDSVAGSLYGPAVCKIGGDPKRKITISELTAKCETNNGR